jgi:hypothetical protein
MCRLLFFAVMSAVFLQLSGCSTEQLASQQAVPVAPAEQHRIPVPSKPDEVVKKPDPALAEAWRRAEGEIANELRGVQSSYAENEIESGAKPRTWPELRLSDTVSAKLTTSWSNLAVDYKLTLSGERSNLESLLAKHKRMRVRFAQPNGITTTQFPISAKEFRLAGKSESTHAISQATAEGTTQSGLVRYLQADRWYIVWLE